LRRRPRKPHGGELRAAASPFPQGLKEAEFTEGQNLIIAQLRANDDHGKLPGLAAEVTRNQMALIATIGAQLNTGDFHIRSHVACISVAIAPPAGNNGFPDDAS
jgi:hypothetical protein